MRKKPPVPVPAGQRYCFVCDSLLPDADCYTPQGQTVLTVQTVFEGSLGKGREVHQRPRGPARRTASQSRNAGTTTTAHHPGDRSHGWIRAVDGPASKAERRAA